MSRRSGRLGLVVTRDAMGFGKSNDRIFEYMCNVLEVDVGKWYTTVTT